MAGNIVETQTEVTVKVAQCITKAGPWKDIKTITIKSVDSMDQESEVEARIWDLQIKAVGMEEWGITIDFHKIINTLTTNKWMKMDHVMKAVKVDQVAHLSITEMITNIEAMIIDITMNDHLKHKIIKIWITLGFSKDKISIINQIINKQEGDLEQGFLTRVVPQCS